jgi:glycine/D-amino acid oxidase-like deaminating enzyme
MPHEYPKLLSPVKTDVAIIGGGISGALTAYHLTKAGIECVVVDGRSIGLGSTCASTSLLQYEIDVSLTDLSKKIGGKDAATAYLLCKQSIHKLSAIAAAVGLREFELNKSLYFAAYRKDTGFLEEEYKARKSVGLRVELLDKKSIEKRFGFSAPCGILSFDGAYSDAYLFTHAIHQHCIKKGLQVFDRTYINRITDSGKKIKLLSDTNIAITANHVVYATGYETTELIKKKIVNLHSTYATISEHLSEEADVLKKDVMLWNTADPYLYIRGSTEGRVIVGGRDEKFFNAARRDKLISSKSAQLARDYNKLFPSLNFKSEFSWAGTFGSTADGLPFIGPYKKGSNRLFALGFGGNGITFSLIAAEIIRDTILGKTNKHQRLFSFERV